MTTLTNPYHKAPDGLGVKPDEILLGPQKADNEAEAPTETVEPLIKELIEGPLGADWVGLPVRIARQISAIYGRLAGQPSTDQDRKRAILAHAENVHRFI